MKKSVWLLLSLSALASFAMMAAGGRAAKTQTPARPDEQELMARRRFQKPPKIVSLVKSLRVEKTEIDSSGEMDYLLLTLRNNTEKTVACVSFCPVMHERGYSSWTECYRMFTSTGAFDPVDDAVEPYGERFDRIGALAFDPDKPLFVCAATFTDGTQEGERRVRESQKEWYEKVKEMRRDRKGVN